VAARASGASPEHACIASSDAATSSGLFIG
jgi:hypothetical protein